VSTAVNRPPRRLKGTRTDPAPPTTPTNPPADPGLTIRPGRRWPVTTRRTDAGLGRA
jgi:hypothetical protein